MKLLSKWQISKWAYEQCLNNDIEEIRNLITDPYIAYLYCTNVKDRPEVRKYIKDPFALWELSKNKTKKRSREKKE